MATFNSNYGRRDSYIQLTVNPRAYNISSNSTVVDWSLRVYTGVTYWQGNVQTSNVYIDGGSSLWSASTSTTYAVRTWYNLGSGSKTIPHNSDGTKTISISAAFAVEAGGAGIGSVSINTSMALPTIPRASSIGTISGNQIGSEITVNISRASSSFTHKVWVRYPGGSWDLITSSAGTSAVFTSPMSACSFFPNSTSGMIEISVQTMSGSTNIGPEVRKTHTVHVPSSVVPSFSSLSVSEGNAYVTSAIGNAYVQNKSSAKLTISGASGIHGSSIRSYSITGHGINASGSSGTTSTITSSGNITYTAVITDSRGRTASRTETINVLAYTGPKLSGLSYYRSNSSGVQDPLGTSITIKGTVTSSSLKVGGVEKNIVNYQSQTALGSAWTARTQQSYAKTSHAYSATFAGFGVDNSYNVRSRAGDIFDWGSWSAGIIPTGEVTQQWSRKTTSFGKMIDNSNYNIQAGSGGIHSDGPIYQNNRQEVVGVSKITDGNTTGVLYARVASFSTDESVALMVFNGGDYGTNKRQTGIISGGSRNNVSGIEYTEFTGSSNPMRVYTKNLGNGNFEVWLSKAPYQRPISVIGFHDTNQEKIEKNPVWVSSSSGLSQVRINQVLTDNNLSGQFLSGSDGTRYWRKTPDGVLEEWGHVTFSAGVNSTTLYFMQGFVNTRYILTFSSQYTGGNLATTTSSTSVNARGTTSCTIYNWNDKDKVAPNIARNVYYHAIGFG